MLMLVAAPQTAQASSSSTTTQPPSSGGIGVRLLPTRVSAVNDPRARVYIIENPKPGTTIERVIAVSNTTGSPQDVTLYAGGARFANETFVPGPNNALSTWITVRPSSVNLPQGTSQNAHVTIAVPRTASPGESYAVVWAAVEVPGSVITQINRVGIRVYLAVRPGSLSPTTSALGPQSATNSSNGNSDTPYLIGGIAAAVLVAAVGGGVLHRRRSRRHRVPQHAKRVHTTTTQRRSSTT
jgi:hypothetical protein